MEKECSRHSTDRIAPSEGANVSSILTESTTSLKLRSARTKVV